MKSANSRGSKADIIFFVRSFNDIDHMAPLIEHLCSENEFCVSVYCVDWNFDINANINIEYLCSKYSLSTGHLWNPRSDSLVTRILIHLISFLRSLKPHINKPYVWRLNRPRALLERFLQNSLSIEKIFKQHRPSAFVFDLGNAEHPRNRSLVTAARNHQIPTFCLPHSISLFSNKFITKKKTLAQPNRRLFFDHYFCPGLHTSYLSDRGIPPGSIYELGSMRFSREWMTIVQNQIVKEEFSSSSIGLKVVIFLSQSTYNVSDEALTDMVRNVSQLQGVVSVIKPHTRGMSLSYLENLTAGTNAAISTKHHSASLIKWSDVVIVYGSSIAIDALTINRPVIYPNFIDSNSIYLTEFNACLEANSIDELLILLQKMIHGEWSDNTAQHGIDRYLETVVYAGNSSRNVIHDHATFFKQKIVQR